MKRLVAQLQESTKPDYDPEEKGAVVSVGEHHGGDFHVYFAHKITKLREVQANNWQDLSSSIFKGCIIYINGLTDPPIDEMRRIIGTNGGECIQYRAVKITHLVCNYFTDAQLKLEFAKVKLNATHRIYYVTDKWITESIKQGRRLDENIFLPAGVSKQHGGTLTSLYTSKSAASTSSSASLPEISDQAKRRRTDDGAEIVTVDLCAESQAPSSSSRSKPGLRSDEGATGAAGVKQVKLSDSQENFLDSLPEELRAEALQQLVDMQSGTRNQDTERLAGELAPSGSNNDSSNRSSSSSSSRGGSKSNRTNAADSNCSDRTGDIPPEASSVIDLATVPTNSASQRRQDLTQLVAHLHHNADGSHCTSKLTIKRSANYIHELVRGLFGVRCGPGETINCSAVSQLLTDYAHWLLKNSLYDQVGQCYVIDTVVVLCIDSTPVCTVRQAQVFSAQLKRQVQSTASQGHNDSEDRQRVCAALQELCEDVSAVVATGLH
jgi:hypothetical protein